MYPVSGPVAAKTPPPVFRAKISANMAAKSGAFSTTLENGERFDGRWKLGTPGPADPSSPTDLSVTWDSVFGQGYYVAHVLGNRTCGGATITGSAGTVLQLQLCGGDGQKAVAKDSHGNVYKMTVS
jgi:hypothetical protein